MPSASACARSALQPIRVERDLNGPVGAHPFAGLDDAGIEHLRQHDLAVEKPRPRLIAQPKLVAQALRGDQHHRLALALQKRVGGNGGPHFHAGHPGHRNGCRGIEVKEPSDAVQRRVLVLFRVLGKKLGRVQRPVRTAGHDVGEGAAPVDPEVPTCSFDALHCFQALLGPCRGGCNRAWAEPRGTARRGPRLLCVVSSCPAAQIPPQYPPPELG